MVLQSSFVVYGKIINLLLWWVLYYPFFSCLYRLTTVSKDRVVLAAQIQEKLLYYERGGIKGVESD